MSLILGALYMLVIGAATASMAVLLLKGKKEPYNKMYLGCQGMVVLWCVSQIFILLAQTKMELLFSYLLGNIGVCFVGAFWFGFAFLYGGKELPKGIQYLPFGLSGLHYLMILTNHWHHLYYTSFSREKIAHGMFFYTNVAETYLFVAAGAILLYRSIDREHMSNRLEKHFFVKRKQKNPKQVAGTTAKESSRAKTMVIVAVLVPVLFNLFYMTGLVKASFDITPLGFGISNILVMVATFKYRFMEINITAFDVILSGLSDGVGIFNAEGKCTFSNAVFYNLLRTNAGQERELFNQRRNEIDAQQVCERIATLEVREENVFVDEEGRYLQIQIYQNDLDEEMQEMEFANLAASRTTVFVMKDISRYYELLRQTRELAVTNERLALEKERNRIAQQVHDTAGHTLTMIQSYMKLAAVANEKQEKDKVREYLDGARGLSGEGIKELRQSINQLRKEAESELVTQGILQLADQVKEIPVEVTVQGEDSEKYSHLSRVLYECVRESITNTLKYAQASGIEIILRFNPENVELVIADDGTGCEEITENNGFRGIRKKINAVGGSVRFISGKGEGFLTRIQVPV